MPKLIVKKKAEVIEEYDLKNSEASMSIGSEDINDLKIDDRLISMQHARIERTSNRFFIRDLHSAFGTFINGERVEDIAEIHNGDDIKVGEHSILFDNPLENMEFSLIDEADFGESTLENGSETITQAENTKLDEFETKIRKESLTLLRQSADDESNLLPYQLLAVYGPYKGKRYQLLQPETKIGRDDKLNDVILDKDKNGEPDQSISRRHATIVHKDGSFFISDKRSKTRTYVNRQVVPEDGEIEIFPNDEVEIVSDKQSSIFRLLEDGNSNYGPPKKAGVWWVRFQPLFLTIILLIAISLGAFSAQYGYQIRSVLTQKPEPLTLDLNLWSTEKSLTIQNNSTATGDNDEREAAFVPVISDFNGDGVIDIANTNIANKPILIDGATKSQRWLDAMPVKAGSALMAADINQNYLDDLIYISNDRRVVVFDIKNEAEVWSSDIFENELAGHPVLGDFNGDELIDIAVLDVEGTVHIGFNQLLSLEWSAVHHGVPTLCPMTSSDLDKDGIDELLYGSERGIVFIIDCVKKTIKGTIDLNEELNQALGTFYEDNQIRFPVGVADLNGDQNSDIIISTVQGRIVAIDGATRKRLWHDVLLDELSLSFKTYPFILGDFNGDGLKDIATCSEDGYLTAYNGKGLDQNASILWQLKSEVPIIISSLAVADFNKDYISDVILENIEGTLLIIDGANGKVLSNSDQTSAVQTSPPLIADLQHDGFLDILTITQTGIAFQYKTNTQIQKGTIVWGAKYSGYKTHLSESYILPKTNRANIFILLGLLLISGSGATSIIIKKKRTLK